MLVSSPEITVRALRLGLAAILVATSAFIAAAWFTSALPSHAVQWIKWLLIAPFIEEMFFRGVVQAGLRARADFWGRPWTAISVTAVCFGLAHLVAASALHSALAIAPALAIGWAYEKSRSILLCIVLHGTCNAIALVLRSI